MPENKSVLVPKQEPAVLDTMPGTGQVSRPGQLDAERWAAPPVRETLRAIFYSLGMLLTRVLRAGQVEAGRNGRQRLARRGNGCGCRRGQGRGRRL